MTNRRLRPTLPHRAGEVPTSFASRLAQLHMVEDAGARFFCADMGIPFGELAHGLSHPVKALAELAGVEPDRLRVEAFQRVSGGYLFRNEIFPKGSLHRTMLRFCPACLIEDCDTVDRPELAAHGRSIWLLSFLRTCPIHCMEIVEFGGRTSPSKAHDFAQQVKPFLPELERIAARAVQRPTSPLENYALDRLAGIVGNAPWLDLLPLHVAVAACDYIGMVQRFGRDVRPSELSGSERMEAGGCGFRIAEAGEAGIAGFMSELIRTYPYSRSATEGPQAVLGRWFKFLAYEAPHPAFDGIRDFVSDFLIERMPFGPGDSIFGKPVTRRVLHSVHTASQEIKVHPKRLRKVLHAAGVLTRQQLDLPNDNAIFDAAAAAQTLRDAVDGLFMTEVESYLGAGRVRTKLLVDAGIVQPMFPKRPDLDHLFRRRDLDAFLDRLFTDALPIDEFEADVANIQTTAKRVCCGAMEIVRLVLDRKLSWVGRHTGLPGFAALHVRISEVRSIVRGSMEGWLTVQSIEKTMHTSTAVVKKLIDYGHLKTEIIISPLNRCPVRVIRQSEFDLFQNKYTTLFQGMEETGIHFLKLQSLLKCAGIGPSIRREDVGAAFYLRSDLIRI